MRADGRHRDKRPAHRRRRIAILGRLLDHLPVSCRDTTLTPREENPNRSLNHRLKNPPPEPPGPFIENDEDYDGDRMLEGWHADPFPRTRKVTIFVDTRDRLLATVSHHVIHYVPDSVGAETQDQFEAGPGSEGKPGLLELALCTMVYFLPSGFDGDGRVMLRTPRPNSEPMPISRPAWDLHVEFAEEVLIHIDPKNTDLEPDWVYAWIAGRRPDLTDLVFAEPTPDPFEGLF